MVVFFARSGARHPVLPAALGLLIGGSLSNLVDRIRLHHVTDFIDLGWWPAFNLADSFIVIGVAILLARARRRRPAGRGRRAARSTSQPGEGSARRRRVSGSTAFSPRNSARARRPSGRSTPARSSTASRASKSYRLDGGRGGRGGRTRRPSPPAAAGGAARSCGRTSTCSWSTSRRASSSIPAPDTRAARSSTRSPGRSAGGDPRAPGRRAPPRSRHVGPDRARALRGGARRAHGARPGAGVRAHLPRARPRHGRVREPAGSRRRSAATAATRRGSRSTRTRRATAITHFEVERALAGARAAARLTSRRDGCTRSASTWLRSTCPSSAIRSYGVPRAAARAAVPPRDRRSRFPHPFTGERLETASELPPDLARFLADLS